MKLQQLLLLAPILLFSMVAHEIAHGWAALRQGDPTARDAGRLSWNPLRHIDPFFTIVLPLMTALSGGFIFGGAKPVPVDPRNYRHYRRGDIIVSLAGVATNVLIAALCTLLVVPVGMLGRQWSGAAEILGVLQAMLLLGIQVNLLLAVFNLLPIPPLDGSHVVKHLLPAPLAQAYARAARFGFLILVALLFVARDALAWWMRPVRIGTDAALRLVYTWILPTPWTS